MSFVDGVLFGSMLTLLALALILRQLTKASDASAAKSAVALTATAAHAKGGAAGARGADGTDKSTAAAALAAAAVAPEAAATLELLLRSLSRRAFIDDPDLYVRSGDEAAVAALDGVLRRADDAQVASELATADPCVLATLLLQRMRALTPPLLAPHSARPAVAVALVDAARAAGTACDACGDDDADGQNREPASEAAEQREAAVQDLRRQLAELPALNKRVIARLARHLHRLAESPRNTLDASALGNAMADVLFSPATDHASDAVAAIVRCYPMLRSAFSTNKKERAQYYTATSDRSRARITTLLQASPGAHQQDNKSTAGKAKGKKAKAAAGATAAETEAETETARWANHLAARWFAEYGAAPSTVASLHDDIQKSLNSIDRPSFLMPIDVVSVSLGAALPELRSVRHVPQTRKPGELALNMQLSYVDGLAVTLRVPVSLAGFVVPLTVRVTVARLDGRLAFFLPAPRDDRGYGWVSFVDDPEVQLSLELVYADEPQAQGVDENTAEHSAADTAKGQSGRSKGTVGSLALDQMPALGDFIRSKLRSELHSMMVLPKWDRVAMPWNKPLVEADGYLSPEDGEDNEGDVRGGTEGGDFSFSPEKAADKAANMVTSMGAERVGAVVGGMAGRFIPVIGGNAASKVGQQLGSAIGKEVAKQKPEEIKKAGLGAAVLAASSAAASSLSAAMATGASATLAAGTAGAATAGTAGAAMTVGEVAAAGTVGMSAAAVGAAALVAAGGVMAARTALGSIDADDEDTGSLEQKLESLRRSNREREQMRKQRRHVQEAETNGTDAEQRVAAQESREQKNVAGSADDKKNNSDSTGTTDTANTESEQAGDEASEATVAAGAAIEAKAPQHEKDDDGINVDEDTQVALDRERFREAQARRADRERYLASKTEVAEQPRDSSVKSDNTNNVDGDSGVTADAVDAGSKVATDADDEVETKAEGDVTTAATQGSAKAGAEVTTVAEVEVATAAAEVPQTDGEVGGATAAASDAGDNGTSDASAEVDTDEPKAAHSEEPARDGPGAVAAAGSMSSAALASRLAALRAKNKQSAVAARTAVTKAAASAAAASPAAAKAGGALMSALFSKAKAQAAKATASAGPAAPAQETSPQKGASASALAARLASLRAKK